MPAHVLQLVRLQGVEAAVRYCNDQCREALLAARTSRRVLRRDTQFTRECFEQAIYWRWIRRRLRSREVFA